MRFEFAEQYSRVCVMLDNSDVRHVTADELVRVCHDNECTYNDGEDVCLVISFPGRPQELYTEEAARRSLIERNLIWAIMNQH